MKLLKMDKTTFDGDLNKKILSFWGYHPGLRDEDFQKEIYLTNKKILWFEETIFNGFTKLTLLDLSYNKLTRLNGKIFNGLINLKTLYLNNNQIETCCDQDKLFEGLNKLEVLHLNKNKIQSIPEYEFKDLVNLLELNLESNCIRSIHYESLIGLKKLNKLNIKWNCIAFISADALQGCDGLNSKLDQKKLDEIFGTWSLFGCNPICKKNLRLMPNKSIVFDE